MFTLTPAGDPTLFAAGGPFGAINSAPPVDHRVFDVAAHFAPLTGVDVEEFDFTGKMSWQRWTASNDETAHLLEFFSMDVFGEMYAAKLKAWAEDYVANNSVTTWHIFESPDLAMAGFWAVALPIVISIIAVVIAVDKLAVDIYLATTVKVKACLAASETHLGNCTADVEGAYQCQINPDAHPVCCMIAKACCDQNYKNNYKGCKGRGGPQYTPIAASGCTTCVTD